MPSPLVRRWEALSARAQGAIGFPSAFVLMLVIHLGPFNQPLRRAIVYAVLYVGYSIWMDRKGGDNVNHSAHLWGAPRVHLLRLRRAGGARWPEDEHSCPLGNLASRVAFDPGRRSSVN